MASKNILAKFDTDSLLNRKSIVEDEDLITVDQMQAHHWKEFETINKSWRDKHPYEQGKDIGFWVLRGWYEVNDTRAEKNYCLQQKRGYARIVFQDWLGQIKRGERTQEDVEKQEDKDFRNLELLFYDEDRVRPVETEQELFEADIVQLSCGIRKSFRTEGFVGRSFVEQMKQTIGKGLPIKMLYSTSVFYDVVKSTVKDVFVIVKEEYSVLRNKDLGWKEKLKVLWSSLKKNTVNLWNHKVSEFSDIFAMVQSMVYSLLFSFLAPVFLTSILHLVFPNIQVFTSMRKIIAAFMGVDAGSLFGLGASAAVSYVIGAIVAKIIMEYITKDRTKYEEFSDGLFAGTLTPEKMEVLYGDRLDKIMDDSNLDYKEMKEKMLELHTEFQNNVRPAIERGLFYNRALEDQSVWDLFPESDRIRAKYLFKKQVDEEYGKDEVGDVLGISPLKKASTNKDSFMVRYLSFKLSDDVKCHLEEVIQSGEFSNTFYNVLSGKEKIGDEVRTMLKERPSLVKGIQSHIESHIESLGV